MIARELINDSFPPLKLSDTGLRALSWMEEFRLVHIPVVEGQHYLGLVSEEDILKLDSIVAAIQPIIAAYRSGDTPGAVDGFLRHVCGDGYRGVLDRVLPGAFDVALGEADLFFQAEMPAVQQWSFGPDDAKRVTQPVLNVSGELSVPRFVEGSELVQSWFPQAERLTVPDAGHLLMVQNPTAVADGLIEFFSRHPIALADTP